MSKIGQKKDKKREKLLQSSYDLFLEKGVVETTISMITRHAGVAKGTFYLYFSDKYELLNELILYRSTKILKNAIAESVKLPKGDISDRAIFMVEYVIEFFKENKAMLKLIDKNLSWGMFVESIEKDDSYSDIREFSKIILGDFEAQGYTQEKAEQTIFIIIEMLGSVCYSSIILNQPAPIDTMKPLLFEVIRKILN